MNWLKKFYCIFIAVAIAFSSAVFADDFENGGEVRAEGLLEDGQYPVKTIYNFSCYETTLKLANAEEVKIGSPVSGYLGYTDNFLIKAESFKQFDYATVLRRNKSAAAGVTYKQSAYGNNGSLLDGEGGRDYFMSFDISSGATVYLIDCEGMGWPSRTGGFYNAGKYGSYNVYGKHFDAGEKVNVPCYGWDESWDKEASRLFMNPSYYVVAWDNDASASSFTYEMDENVYNVNSDLLNENGGEYTVEIPYNENGCEIDVSLTANDLQANVERSGEESFLLTFGQSKNVTYTITSEGEDNTAVYSVTFTMLEKKNANIQVNPYIESYFNAKSVITEITVPDELAGDTDTADVKIATYDDNGYLRCGVYSVTYTENSEVKTALDVSYANLYDYVGNSAYSNITAKVTGYNYAEESTFTVNRGKQFFKEGHNFGITGVAFDSAEHVLTSRQFAPGRVNESAFNASGEKTAVQLAEEFKSWLTDGTNYMFSMTPNYSMTVYVAFCQSNAENHETFLNDGWEFMNCSDMQIPDEGIMEMYRNVENKTWWMVDSAYNISSNSYALTKIQYDQASMTASRTYSYIWKKFVPAGETVQIPAGGIAFSGTGDNDAPKVLLKWSDKQINGDLSGTLKCGDSEIRIINSSKPMNLSVIAEVGDELSFMSESGAEGELSVHKIESLPVDVTLKITSTEGSSVEHNIRFKEQPYIKSVTPSARRDKFVANTGNNKIEVSPYLAGRLTQSSVGIQKFEEDADGVLQPVYIDGKLQFETKVKTVGTPFYRDRSQHKFIHVGEGFKNMNYFWIPSNDAVARRKSVYASENSSYFAQNGVEKTWQIEDDDGQIRNLSYDETCNEYTNYILGLNEYFSFVPSDSGVVYVALESESGNFKGTDGWKKMTVDVPLPEGHAGWNSVEADVNNQYYPYQLGKIQYDGHATEYHKFDVIYYKSFAADESVSIPTSGLNSSDVMAVLVSWEEFVSDKFDGKLKYNSNYINVSVNKDRYKINVIDEKDIDLSYIVSDYKTNCILSDEFILNSELPKTITAHITNAFGVTKSFEFEFVKEPIAENKVFNFYTASQYGIYNSENGDAYNTDKGLISFSAGVYMLEENLSRDISAYYSDRLTHKFTEENTSEMFEGASYVRRPKKSGDYGYEGVNSTSEFYTNGDYNGDEGGNGWIGFNISSSADVYVGVGGDGVWPNKPDDWQEVSDSNIRLAGCSKLYVKSFNKGDYVCIPSMGWDFSWDMGRECWDLPVYVINWK